MYSVKESPFSPPEATLGNIILFSSLSEYKMLPRTLDHKHGLNLVTTSSWLSFLFLCLQNLIPIFLSCLDILEEGNRGKKGERLSLIGNMQDSIMLSGSVKCLKLLFLRHIWELLGFSSIISPSVATFLTQAMSLQSGWWLDFSCSC